MRYRLTKFVNASTALEAISLDAETPVHDYYLKEGEEPPRENSKDLIGFTHPEEASFGFTDEPRARKR